MDASWLPSLAQYDASATRTPAQNPPAYNSATAPINATPAIARAAGVAGDLATLAPNQALSFGAGAFGVDHAMSNTPVYDGLVRGPEGDQHVATPNFAQRAGAVGYDVLSAVPRLFKAAGHFLDPAEVGPTGSFTPSYDVIRGLDAKAATVNAAADAKTAPAIGDGPLPAGFTAMGDKFNKYTTAKTKVTPMDQVMQASQQQAVDPKIPLGALMEIAKIANTRRIISAKDQILGQVYGWHRQNYLDALDKKDAPRAQKSLETLTGLANAPLYGMQQMYGGGTGLGNPD